MARTHTVTSFPASAVPRDQLGDILADYLALERLKVLRRLLLTRFGVLAVLVCAAAQLTQLLSPLTSLLPVAVLMAVPAATWAAEVHAELRLTRRLSNVPPDRIESSSTTWV